MRGSGTPSVRPVAVRQEGNMKAGRIGFVVTLVSAVAASCTVASQGQPAGGALERSVEGYQRALIAHGVTGSNVAGVFRGEQTLAYSIANSGLEGDTAITADTIFPIWSMSKPITTVAMMILHERGRYQLDDPVSTFLPEFAQLRCRGEGGATYPCRNELRVVHLLTHQSGYAYYEPGKGPNILDAYDNLEQFTRALAAHPLEFEPGTKYVYGLNQAILGRLVEVLSGQEFFVFLKETIFTPLGMTETKFFLTPDDRRRFQILFRKPALVVDPDRFEEGSIFTREYDELKYTPGTRAQYGGEGLVSTFGDYRRFCEMLLGRGVFRGTRIISEQSISLMTAPVVKGGLMRGYDNGNDFGYSVFVLDEPALDGTGSPKGIWGWSGYHNTHFWIDYENNLYGLFMSRTTPFSPEIQKQFRAAVYQGLRGR
jgi:CubicO group peptidase (beta-lactamase class C family)